MGQASSTPLQNLNVALQNQTTSSTVYAYITGQAINNNNALVLLQADGKSLYYPTSPSSNGSQLAVDCGIRLGAPGSNTVVTIPQIAGGRIWFCVGGPLTFLLNPGPGLVCISLHVLNPFKESGVSVYLTSFRLSPQYLTPQTPTTSNPGISASSHSTTPKCSSTSPTSISSAFPSP